MKKTKEKYENSKRGIRKKIKENYLNVSKMGKNIRKQKTRFVSFELTLSLPFSVDSLVCLLLFLCVCFRKKKKKSAAEYKGTKIELVHIKKEKKQ